MQYQISSCMFYFQFNIFHVYDLLYLIDKINTEEEFLYLIDKISTEQGRKVFWSPSASAQPSET